MYVGGYQIIDCSVVPAITTAAVNVTNKELAEQFRSSKVPFVSELTVNEVKLSGFCTFTETGAYDGKVCKISNVTVTTNDNVVTFTPA